MALEVLTVLATKVLLSQVLILPKPPLLFNHKMRGMLFVDI